MDKRSRICYNVMIINFQRMIYKMSKKILTYREQMEIEYVRKIRVLLSQLPPYITDFFRGRETTTSVKTRISYAYDLKIFFHFLIRANPALRDTAIRNVSLRDLDRLTLTDFEEYQEYLKVYEDPDTGAVITNDARGISRKLSSMRSLLSYLYRHNMIQSNEAAKIEMPRLHEKTIIRLDPDEVAEILDNMEACRQELTPHKRAYYDKTIIRDIAIITLMLGTGIRVSECIGLDIQDVDFKNNGIQIIRKGGKQMTVYFGEEVEEALLSYLEEREKITPLSGHENALFLSLQKKRIGTDAVEDLVKKYTRPVVPNKKITPHKLRSTYGTNLYRETGDVYLVAEVLGHSDINTTRKHYAAIEDDRRRSARDKVRLREKRS